MHIISKINMCYFQQSGRYIMTSRLFDEENLGQTYLNWAVKSPAFLETSTLAVSEELARTHINSANTNNVLFKQGIINAYHYNG
jgi:hypothetical protein